MNLNNEKARKLKWFLSCSLNHITLICSKFLNVSNMAFQFKCNQFGSLQNIESTLSITKKDGRSHNNRISRNLVFSL